MPAFRGIILYMRTSGNQIPQWPNLVKMLGYFLISPRENALGQNYAFSAERDLKQEDLLTSSVRELGL